MAEKYYKKNIYINKILKKKISGKIALKRYALKINAKCCYCGIKYDEYVRPTIDHLTPLVLGGETVMSNLVVCCSLCNGCRKGCRTIEEFIKIHPIIIKHLKRYMIKFQNLIVNKVSYIEQIEWLNKVIYDKNL